MGTFVVPTAVINGFIKRLASVPVPEYIPPSAAKLSLSCDGMVVKIVARVIVLKALELPPLSKLFPI